jgi:uncharacterized damage-inducible protein DinB
MQFRRLPGDPPAALKQSATQPNGLPLRFHTLLISTTMNRRSFVKGSALVTLSNMAIVAGLPTACAQQCRSSGGLYTIGPQPGYSPHIGTLVSMLNYNRQTIIDSIDGLTTAELDFLVDAQANSIGALVLHLAAIEKIYQVTTFEGRKAFNNQENKDWKAALDLGDAARKTIKGQPASYYLERIAEVRDKTLSTLKTKDDDWLLRADKENVNNYWRWFHVCEHESNHRGQITWLRKRIPAR